MGTATQHEEKARHHLQFLGTISDDYPDWLATVAFYAAVELIELLFADHDDFHSQNHEDRNRSIHQRFPRLAKPFKALYNASLDSRYQAMEHWLSAEEVRRELVDRRLAHIKSFVESHRRTT
jgi:hypothetical protein